MKSVFYITLKDIKAFYSREKRLFVFYLASMVICAFMINFSYSFANYRGELHDSSTGAGTPIVKVRPDENISTDILDEIMETWGASDNGQKYPIAEYVCFVQNDRGMQIAGSSFISTKHSILTGLWVEGYWRDISPEDGKVIALNGRYLDYTDHMKMTGEVYELDGQEYIISGVYCDSFMNDAVIFYDDFVKAYGVMDSFWLIMPSDFDDTAANALVSIIQEYIPHGTMELPVDDVTSGEIFSISNKTQYSLIIVVLVYFVAMLYNFWHKRNLPVYTVYWLVGMTPAKIVSIAVAELILLFGGTYIVGFLLNLFVRVFISEYLAVTPADFILGFGLTFAVMLLCVIKNMRRMCRSFSVTNLRGEG